MPMYSPETSDLLNALLRLRPVRCSAVLHNRPPRATDAMSRPFTDEAIQHVADELAGFLDDPLARQQFLHYLAQDHHVRVRTEPDLHTPVDYPIHFD